MSRIGNNADRLFSQRDATHWVLRGILYTRRSLMRYERTRGPKLAVPTRARCAPLFTDASYPKTRPRLPV